MEKLATPTTSDTGLSPTIKWHANSNFYLVFKGTLMRI